MTTQKAIDIFSILQDKYGAPELVSTEVVDLLNMATYEWLSRLVPSNLGKLVNHELDQNTLSAIRPLIYSLQLTPAASIVTNAEITTALQTGGAETGATWFRLTSLRLSVAGITYVPKFRTWNNFVGATNNFFKKAKTARPALLLHKGGIEITPWTTGTIFFMTVIKTPKTLSLTGPINPELEDAQMYNIIALALKLGGISTRDEEMIVDVRNTAMQTVQ
jgi:hypothetical protein